MNLKLVIGSATALVLQESAYVGFDGGRIGHLCLDEETLWCLALTEASIRTGVCICICIGG